MYIYKAYKLNVLKHTTLFFSKYEYQIDRNWQKINPLFCSSFYNDTDVDNLFSLRKLFLNPVPAIVTNCKDFVLSCPAFECECVSICKQKQYAHNHAQLQAENTHEQLLTHKKEKHREKHI